MDQITLTRIQTAHPKVRAELASIYSEICTAINGRAMCRFTHVLRSMEEQNNLYAQGRTKQGSIVTWAKAGESYHNYGLSVDIVLIVDKDGDGNYESASWDLVTDFDGDGIADWKEVVMIFKKYGWTWGGDWNKPKTDSPHFEKTFGYSVMDLKAAMQSGKTINGYINI